MNSSSQHPILLVVLAFFVLTSTLLAATGDTLSVGNSAGLPGMSGYTIPVNLRNVTTLKGLLFKIKDLPDSLVVTNVVSTGRASGFQVAWTPVGGTVKILMYPTNGTTPLLTAGNGTIANLTVSVNPAAVRGTKATVIPDSLKAANATQQAVTVYVKSGYFWYGIKGDIKADGLINLFDVLRLIDIVLGRTPSANEYEKWSSDLNKDGVIDVADITSLIDLAVAATPRVANDLPADYSGHAELSISALPKDISGPVSVPV
ncbi:MAG TPA: dockerin type I repeat-containing protein, partial [bacterium]|nr:dockerin type I repeat-containing protein [bacterium]